MSTAWQVLARVEELVALRRFAEAADAVSPALVESGTAARGFCLLAQCRLELDDPKGAEQAAREALAAGAAGEWPHRLLAISHLRRRQPRPALAAAEAAVRAEPEDDHALHVLTVVRLGLRSKRQAMPVAQDNVRYNPDSSLAHRTLATVHAALGNATDAEYYFRNALRLDPEDKEAALELARLLRGSGRDHEAAQLYLAAAAVDPTDSRIRKGLSRLGLPVVGAGALGVGKVVTIIGAQAAVHSIGSVSFLVLTVVWLTGAVSVTGITTTMRVRAGRSLPPAVRAGLRADYRNDVLRAGFVTGLGCLVLALLGLLADSVGGAIALGVLGLALLVAHRRWWSGPRPRRRLRLRRWAR